MTKQDAAAIAVGAGLAVATDRGARRVTSGSRMAPAGALGLVTAAAIYPAARIGRAADADVARREWLAVGATVAVLAAASRSGAGRVARATVAVGWIAHAAFDNLHDRGPTSRLPDWYPAACAGYDVALAGLLLRP